MLNTAVYGDVTIVVYHARSAFGGKVQGKVRLLLMLMNFATFTEEICVFVLVCLFIFLSSELLSKKLLMNFLEIFRMVSIGTRNDQSYFGSDVDPDLGIFALCLTQHWDISNK